MKNLNFEVNLDNLYKIEETCNYNKNNMFCPILLKVNDDFLLEQNGRDE